MKKLFLPLMMGSIFGALTIFMVQSPEQMGAASIFLFPGFILRIVGGQNVHEPSTWLATLGNFLFYFGLTYVAERLWERHIRKERERME